MIKSVAFFAYPVTEMERSRSFYEKTLGLVVTRHVQDMWVEYDIAGTTFAITTMAGDLIPGGKGATIALEVEDLESVVSTLKQAQVPVLIEPFETPVCRMAVIADPDGNSITLHQCK